MMRKKSNNSEAFMLNQGRNYNFLSICITYQKMPREINYPPWEKVGEIVERRGAY